MLVILVWAGKRWWSAKKEAKEDERAEGEAWLAEAELRRGRIVAGTTYKAVSRQIDQRSLGEGFSKLKLDRIDLVALPISFSAIVRSISSL